MSLEYIVKSNDKYKSVNDVLKKEFHISTRLLSKIIRLQKVLVNGKVSDTRNTINFGDKITILFDYEEQSENIIPTEMNLNIIYEDDSLLVLNKPAGIPVHPSMAHYTNSLSNAIKFYFEKIKLKKKIRPVNRLDKDTSGIVVFAKNEYIQECLINQMANNTFKKEYIAVVDGILNKKSGIINKSIARKENSIIERCVSTYGKPSITNYKVIKEYENYSVVKCNLITGRTHQIRVHFSFIGHPILSDTLYGNISNLIDRQALHCYKLSFIHPILKKELYLTAPLPLDLLKFFN